MSNEKKVVVKNDALLDAMKEINAIAGRARGDGTGKPAISAEEKLARKLARQEKHVAELSTLKRMVALKKGEEPVAISMNPGQVVTTVCTAIRNGLSANELEVATKGFFRSVEFKVELPEGVTNPWELTRSAITAMVMSFKRPKGEEKKQALLLEIFKAFNLSVEAEVSPVEEPAQEPIAAE